MQTSEIETHCVKQGSYHGVKDKVGQIPGPINDAL
jgi:hypothetical protein